jgi:hypothetical protein
MTLAVALRAPLVIALAALTMAPPARAAGELKALYEITLDIDRDGKPDRIAIVGPAAKESFSANKDWAFLAPEDRADLYVYLGGGDASVDLTRKPSFLKQGIARGERQGQIFPLEARGEAVIIRTAYNLFSNWDQRALTIVHRHGDLLVAGFARSYDLRNGRQGSCEINFLTGQGLMSKGADGKKKRVAKGRFKPVRLAEWDETKHAKACL